MRRRVLVRVVDGTSVSASRAVPTVTNKPGGRGRLPQDLAFLLQPRTFLRSAAFSAPSRVGGSAGVSALRPRGRLAPAARTRFRRVSGLIPGSAATCRIVASGRDWYGATTSALNCGG